MQVTPGKQGMVYSPYSQDGYVDVKGIPPGTEGGAQRVVKGQGEPGYFKQYLRVYDRQGEPCRSCQTPIRQIRLGQRSSYYCPHCQH